MYKKIIFLASFVYCVFSLNAQIVTSTLPDFDYANPKEYEIGGITISGIKFLDQDVLINLTGLQMQLKNSGSKIFFQILKLLLQEP